MSKLEFSSSNGPSLGVELELALVDVQSGALCSRCPDLIAGLPILKCGTVKPELMECYVETNTDVCKTVREASDQLRTNLHQMQASADAMGVGLLWSATHPFSSWQYQQVTNTKRYHGLVSSLQDSARQLVTYGLHVHVGVDSGDKAIMICDRILRYLPVLLAASCNSPFWEGRNTGLCSWRSKVMEGLPTAGLPPFMRNWSEYVWLVTHLEQTGFIETIREIWWDVRPHHNFGTVEVRVCDMPASLEDATALVALIHCLVKYLSDSIDDGLYQHDCHPMLVRQNKWRAARYGLDAELVDSQTYELIPARETIKRMVEELSPIAEDLDCVDELQDMLRLIAGRGGARRQLDLLAELMHPDAVVRRMLQQTRV